MGVSDEEDRRWHAKHESHGKHEIDPLDILVNPFTIEDGFIDYCVRHGWLVREGRGRTARYYAAAEGREALHEYGITA